MKMVAGIDYSMSCPSVCVHRGNEWNFNNCVFHYFSSRKKLQVKYNNICGDPLPIFGEDNESRWDALSDWTLSKLKDVNIIGLEGYAFGAKGQVFNIGENTGILKYKLYKGSKNLRIFSPGTIKKFATTLGNADKLKMYEAFLYETGFDLTKCIEAKPGQNPLSDIIDAYYIAKLTHYESQTQS